MMIRASEPPMKARRLDQSVVANFIDLPLSAGMITPAQCRAARGLLAWRQQERAQKAGVGVVTVHQLEAGTSEPRLQPLRSFDGHLNAPASNSLTKMVVAPDFATESASGRRPSGRCSH